MKQIISKQDTDENCRLTVWFIVELLQVIKPFVEEESRAELAFSFCCLLDASSADVFGDHVRPVIGFADVKDENPDTFTIIYNASSSHCYSSMHEWVYTIYEILKSHPKFSKIPDRGFTRKDIDELYALI